MWEKTLTRNEQIVGSVQLKLFGNSNQQYKSNPEKDTEESLLIINKVSVEI